MEAIWLPALFGGGVAIGATLAIERWGGVVGGLIATLPTTIVPASFGILAGSADLTAYQQSMAAVPVGMVINGIFLWTWRVLPDRLPPAPLRLRLAWMTALSLAVWATATGASVGMMRAARAAGLGPIPVGVTAFAVLVTLGIVACLRPLPAPKASRRVSGGVLLARGVLAGAAIGLAGAFALSGVPLLAGMASVFPAIFLTTMVSLWWSQGAAVPAGAVGPMMLGSSSVSAFALLAAALLPRLGAVPGTAAAWGCAVAVVTLPATTWLRRRAV